MTGRITAPLAAFPALAALALALAALPGCSSEAFRCESDYDCDGTDLCRVSTGECIPLVSVECREDRDCVDPLKMCRDFACVLRSAGDADAIVHPAQDS